MSVALPNPALPSDQIAAILATLSGQTVPAPGILATFVGTPASTTYTYMIVAKSNGQVIPGSSVSITTGSSSLSTSNYNALSWAISYSNLPTLTWDVYRTAGGATQGRIAIGLPGSVTSLNDIGLIADGTTAPAFNTSGITALGNQEPYQNAAGTADAVTIPVGTVFITGAAIDALTLAAPVAGPPSAGGMDGCNLSICCITAYAHTVTAPANVINGNKHVITFTAAVGNFISLKAFNGKWYATSSTNATLS